MGILPWNFTPAHTNNLILLCSACHDQYDSPYPKWVALPEDLGRFIQFERDDYDARETAATNGVSKQRFLPPVLFFAGTFIS